MVPINQSETALPTPVTPSVASVRLNHAPAHESKARGRRHGSLAEEEASAKKTEKCCDAIVLGRRAASVGPSIRGRALPLNKPILIDCLLVLGF